jgi:hypothetical protein
MANNNWQEGDVVTNPDTGQELTLTGGKWVTAPLPTLAPENNTLSEMKGLSKSGGAGLIKGATEVVGLPGDVQGLANAGLNSFMPAPQNGGQQQPTPSGDYGNVIKALNSAIGAGELPTSQDVQGAVEGVTGPLYQPKTGPEKVAYGAGASVPFGMIGEGAMLPNMLRAGLAGGASEAAGQATAGTPYEMPARMAAGAGIYGLSGALQNPKIYPTNAVQAAAQRQEALGLPIRASDISGSRLQRTLEGGSPPPNRDQAVSSVMQQQGGIPIPPGNTDQYGDLVQRRYANDLQPEFQRLGAQTSFPATPQVRQQLANTVAQHFRNEGGINPEVDSKILDELNIYDQQVKGQSSLGGSQYGALTRKWSTSGVPALQSMAHTIDDAMDAAHPGAWPTQRENYADYMGLKAHADKLSGAAIVTPVSPDTITGTMYKKTPMYRTAEDAQTINAAQPQPYDFHTLSNLGHLASGIVGGVGAAVGATHGADLQGMLTGAETGGLLGFIPPMISGTVPSAAKLAAPMFRTGGGQNFLRNMDPKVVAGLLAQQGIRGKGAPTEEPQGTTQ